VRRVGGGFLSVISWRATATATRPSPRCERQTRPLFHESFQCKHYVHFAKTGSGPTQEQLRRTLLCMGRRAGAAVTAARAAWWATASSGSSSSRWLWRAAAAAGPPAASPACTAAGRAPGRRSWRRRPRTFRCANKQTNKQTPCSAPRLYQRRSICQDSLRTNIEGNVDLIDKGACVCVCLRVCVCVQAELPRGRPLQGVPLHPKRAALLGCVTCSSQPPPARRGALRGARGAAETLRTAMADETVQKQRRRVMRSEVRLRDEKKTFR
jgi:hypothetical protein